MSCTFGLPHLTTSAGIARRHVERFAAKEQLDSQTTVLALVASELVTNAILHGAPPVALTLRYDHDEITIEVADGDRAVADVHFPADDQRTLGGKGLLIVASLADRWGAITSHTGKTVWASINATHA